MCIESHECHAVCPNGEMIVCGFDVRPRCGHAASPEQAASTRGGGRCSGGGGDGDGGDGDDGSESDGGQGKCSDDGDDNSERPLVYVHLRTCWQQRFGRGSDLMPHPTTILRVYPRQDRALK